MASHSKTRSGMTLEEFLRWPEADEHPYKEFINGRIEMKVSPQKKHSVLTLDFCLALNQFAGPGRLGRAFPELRCTFAGRSIIPDVVFLLEANIPCDARGRLVNISILPSDIQIEIRSPGQSLKKTREKLEHAVANGCPLGWLIDPERETADVYRPGSGPERLLADGFLNATPVLPDFRLAVSEVFGWLIYRAPNPPQGDPE